MQSNPPTNPALWKALVQEFVAKKYDRKHMMRLILNSRAYQLSSTTGAATKGTSVSIRITMPADCRRRCCHDAIYTLTGVPDRFDGYPFGLRAVQIPDPTVRSQFFTVFGRPSASPLALASVPAM